MKIIKNILFEVISFKKVDIKPFGTNSMSNEEIEITHKPRSFRDKNGNIYYIYVDYGTTIGVYNENMDQIAYMNLTKNKDQKTYSAKGVISYGIYVDENYRRNGIATAMHDYANLVLGYNTTPSDMLLPDAQAFWKSRLK